MNANPEHAIDLFGKGDYQKSVPALQRLADSGDVDALGTLGLAYQFGEGFPRDLEMAERILLQCSDRGHAASAHNLGTLYASDLRERPNARIRSAEYYLRAESLGLVVAPASFYADQRLVISREASERMNGKLT